MPTLLDRIRQLPPEIQDLLASEEVAEQNERILIDHDVPPEREDAVLACIQAVYLKDRPVESFVGCLREALPGWGDDRLRPLARDGIGYRLLSMSGYLRGVREELIRLGGDAASYPAVAVAVLPHALADVVRDAAVQAGVTLTDPAAARRFEDAVATYLKGIRDRLETTDAFTRGSKTGGVGLTPEQAEQVLIALDASRSALHVEESVAAATPSERRTSDALALEAHEAEEIHRAHPVASNVAGRRALQAVVDRVVGATQLTLPTPELTRRFRLAVETRLRDLRDEHETLDLLTRPTVSGGLGLTTEHAASVIEVLRRELRITHHESRDGATATVPRRADANSPMPYPVPTPTTAIVKELVHPVPVQPQAARPRPIPTQTSVPQDASRSELPSLPPPAPVKPPVPPPPPASKVPPRPPVPPSPIQQMLVSRPPARVAPPPPRPAAPRSPPPIPTRSPSPGPPPTPPSVIREHPPAVRAPSVASAKPKMQDIRPVPPRLVGPVEELGRLTIADFRKLAPSPDAAAQKIIEKLVLLTRDGYAKRAEGIRAFRTSALMVAYGEAVNAALAGKRKADDAVAERSKTDTGALTSEEFSALQHLNAQIRF